MLSVVDKARPLPVYRQIGEAIRREIEAKRLPADTLLASEQELARAHGVSRMTARQAVTELVNAGLVYRVNGKGTFVAERSVERKAAEETIGVIMPSLGWDATLDMSHSPSHFSSSLGAQRFLMEKNYNMTVLARKGDALTATMLNEFPVAGYIVFFPSRDPRVLDPLKECEKPFVVVNASILDVSYDRVDVDLAAAGEQATKLLLDSGKRRVIFVSAPEKNEGIDEFRGGYERVMRAAGTPSRSIWLVPGQGAELPEDIDGVVATSDALALAVYRLLAAAGKRVPTDVAVTGYNDSEAAKSAVPPLTTFSPPTFSLGEAAARLIVEKIETGERLPRLVKIAPIPVRRESA